MLSTANLPFALFSVSEKPLLGAELSLVHTVPLRTKKRHA